MSKQTNQQGKPTRSRAQREADARYADRNRANNRKNQKENFKNIAATLPKAEAEKIAATFKAHGMKPAEVIRRAAVRMEQGDDLRRDYDPASNTLQAAADEGTEGDSDEAPTT